MTDPEPSEPHIVRVHDCALDSLADARRCNNTAHLERACMEVLVNADRPLRAAVVREGEK